MAFVLYLRRSVNAVSAAMLMLGFQVSFAASGVLSYDPLGSAVEELAGMGVPVPDGYTVVEVPEGSLGEGRFATVDNDTQTVSVDVAAFSGAAGNSPEAYVGILMVVLFHEYRHTPPYGGSSVGFCEHYSMAEYDLAFLCELIGDADA